jgi:hypothetical protein
MRTAMINRLRQRLQGISRRSCVGAMLMASLLLTWVFALRSGQDTNWDQRNYHLAVPFLLLQGHFWENVAPAGIQTYLNPLILVPQYLLIQHLPPRLATLVIATFQASTFLVAGLACLAVCADKAGERTMALLGFALCLASPMALSEAGTTYVDLITAVPILIAYWRLLARGTGAQARRACLLAGLLLGVAGGLKLTNLVFCFGVPGLLLAGTESWRERAGLLTRVAAATLVGFLLIAGWWHLALWERFSNPVFPFYNNIFHSPDMAAIALNDPRFLPHSVWDILHYPLYWVTGGSPNPSLMSPASENDPRDPRFLLALLGIIASGIALLLRPDWRRRALRTPATGLLLAWLSVYLVWLGTFAIHRYMVALEIMTGMVLLVLAAQLPGRRLRHGVLIACAVASLIDMHVALWARSPFAGHWRTIAPTPIDLPGKPLVFLQNAPTAYVAASLPAEARFVGLGSEIDLSAGQTTRLTAQVRALLDPAAGRTPYLLTLASHTPDATMLAGYQLRLAPNCRQLAIGLDRFSLCRLVPAD